jgi:hypothetical protein
MTDNAALIRSSAHMVRHRAKESQANLRGRKSIGRLGEHAVAEQLSFSVTWAAVDSTEPGIELRG